MTVHVTGAHASMMPQCIAIATCPGDPAGDAAEAKAAPELAVPAGTEAGAYTRSHFGSTSALLSTL